MDTQITGAKGFSFDMVATWVLAALVPVAALLFIPNASIPFIGTKVAVLAFGVIIAFIAYVIARLARGNVILPPMMLVGALWLVPIAYVLSTLFSGVALERAFFGIEFETDTLGFIILLSLLATLAALAFRRPEEYRRFFGVAFVAYLLVLASQLVFMALAKSGTGIAATNNLIGTFTDLGMVIGLGIVLSLLSLRFVPLSSTWKIGLWLGLLFGLAFLIFVNSQLLWILMALAGGGLFIETVMQRRHKSDDSDLEGVTTFALDEVGTSGDAQARTIGAPLVVLLVSLFFIIGGGSVANALATAAGVSAIDVRPSWQSTFAIGSHTYASSPLFGSGPGTFGSEWLLFRDRALNETIFWNIDFTAGIGFIPTSFVTTGIIGVLAWLAFIGLFLYAGARALLFRLPDDPFARFASLASFAGAFYVLVLAFFSVPGPVVLAAGFALLGIFISTLRFGKGRQEWGVVFSRSPRIGFAIVFALTLLLIASVAGAYKVAERYLSNLAYAEAVTGLTTANVTGAEASVVRSLALSPSARAHRLSATIGIERMRQIAADQSLSPESAQQQFQAALSSSVAAGLESTRLEPKNYESWAVLGNVYRSVSGLNIEGAYEGARGAYEQAIALNPASPILPYILAQLELVQGNGEGAEAALLASVNLKRDYVPAILLLSQLEIQLGKAAEALQAAEAAAYFAPDDSAVLLQVGLLRSGTGDIAGATTALARAVEINPQYANARFFLGAMRAMAGNLPAAAAELREVAKMSAENAAAVAPDLEALDAGRNPFSVTRLRSLGIPQPPVAEPNQSSEQQ